MMQVLKTTRSYSFTSAGTTAVVLTAARARLVTFQAASGNAGTVTILGVSAGTADSAGHVLTAGTFSPAYWVADLSQLAYKLSSANDTLYAVVCV